MKHRVDDLHIDVGKKLDDVAERIEGEAPEPEDRTDLPHQMERIMSALSSGTWLTLATASLLGSIGLRLLGRPASAAFVGQFAPTFLICGLYNKLTTVGAATALLSSRR
jgi:hypothetical protein